LFGQVHLVLVCIVWTCELVHHAIGHFGLDYFILWAIYFTYQGLVGYNLKWLVKWKKVILVLNKCCSDED
jgi:hypothetical protein